MKKLFWLSMMLCISVSAVYAQNERPFRFGLIASPSLSWFNPETRDYLSEGNTIGFSYGLVGDFYLGDYYAVSTGINISHFGGKLSFRYDHGTYGHLDLERKYIHQYIELPLTLKMQTPEFGYMSYFGKFGFAPGFNLKAKGKDTYDVGNRITEDVDLKSSTPLFRAALIIGIGVEYSLGGRTTLLGGVTYNNGFTNNLKGRNNLMDVNPSASASYLQLNIGVMF